MWKDCNILNLPTNDTDAPVLRNTYCFNDAHGNPFKSSQGIENAFERGYEYQHLYILSDDEKKKGDWVWNGRGIVKDNGVWELYTNKKVVASTDPNLNYQLAESGVIDESTNTKELIGDLNIPFIPQYVVDEWINNQFETIEIEYESFNLAESANKSDKSIISNANNWIKRPKCNDEHEILVKLIEEKLYTEKELHIKMRQYGDYVCSTVIALRKPDYVSPEEYLNFDKDD